MISLETALPASNIIIDTPAGSVAEAVEKAVGILQNDRRVLDWDAFRAAVLAREEQSPTLLGGGLMLPHARGAFASALAISCFRLRHPIPAGEDTVHVILAVAIPHSMATDYLRIVGSFARIFREEKNLAAFAALTTIPETRDWLAQRSRA